MRIAFISTVLNEEENIALFLKSILSQTKRPDEVVIVDGGSRDNTLRIIKDWVSKIKSQDFKNRIKIIVKKGNRSLGRNEAIRRSSSDIIACSDAGCILDKNWVKNITSPFKNEKIDVVAGFYKDIAKSVFEKSLIPYVLVMPDKVKPEKFLPAARSMAFKKSVWEKASGFPLNFSNNEDFVFARKLKKIGAKIVFERNALVYYIPRKNIANAFLMFYKFAKGDSESGILRPKVVFVFVRYVILIWFLIYAYFFKLVFILEATFYILIIYIIWSILKNYRYVKDREAFLFLPLIQITSDLAIILGTAFGFLGGLWDTQKRR